MQFECLCKREMEAFKKASVPSLIYGVHSHGKQCKLANGDEYYGECEWINGTSSNVQGTYKCVNENEYSGGRWEDGKRHGQGICKYVNEDEYSGKWNDTHNGGQGTYIYVNRNEYSGGWKDGYHHGQGTIVCKRK